MNKNNIKEMQDLLKRIEKYEVNKNDCKNSLALMKRYEDMTQRIQGAKAIKEANINKLEQLTEELTQVTQRAATEPDESKRRELYETMKRMREDKEFLEMNINHRLIPHLVKESAEMEKSEEFNAAYYKEWGRYAGEGQELVKQLKDLAKKINADIEAEKNNHPYLQVRKTAEQYRQKK